MPRKAKTPLAEYARKRDFEKTPEPAPKVPKSLPKKRALRYCIQKHLASHLHYDLRLEHNGVLLSWAVPKGPSFNPADKRLAMHVEDHPIDYGDFEGVIPEGYGAGLVMLWDTGAWTPEVDDVDAALAKGDLKFSIDGIKLKGSWVLIQTGGRRHADPRQWLLIKHRDAWAGDLDVTTAAPLSVKSFGDFADILAGASEEMWKTWQPHTRAGETGRLLQEAVQKALEIRSAKITKSVSRAKKSPAKPRRKPQRAKTRS